MISFQYYSSLYDFYSPRTALYVYPLKRIKHKLYSCIYCCTYLFTKQSTYLKTKLSKRRGMEIFLICFLASIRCFFRTDCLYFHGYQCINRDKNVLRGMKTFLYQPLSQECLHLLITTYTTRIFHLLQ